MKYFQDLKKKPESLQDADRLYQWFVIYAVYYNIDKMKNLSNISVFIIRYQMLYESMGCCGT